ncbi:hypothetical protein R3P38DRAFT_3188631 [Favolaschia claudopus]|uniref:Uncharacterized protein n=1 Tax=Favolaschia claudopus TaxID=2862362 RepID=A0AAW0BTY5_9AGAR
MAGLSSPWRSLANSRPEGAMGGRLPNLHLANGQLLPAQLIPTWVDKTLQEEEWPLEGYKDQAALDESREWTSLLEGDVHSALLIVPQLIAQPTPQTAADESTAKGIFHPLFMSFRRNPTAHFATSVNSVTPADPLPSLGERCAPRQPLGGDCDTADGADVEQTQISSFRAREPTMVLSRRALVRSVICRFVCVLGGAQRSVECPAARTTLSFFCIYPSPGGSGGASFTVRLGSDPNCGPSDQSWFSPLLNTSLSLNSGYRLLRSKSLPPRKADTTDHSPPSLPPQRLPHLCL